VGLLEGKRVVDDDGMRVTVADEGFALGVDEGERVG